MKFSISPYWIDTVDLPDGEFTSRAWLANVHYYFGFFFIQGHLWHALRALGFDFKRVTNAISNIDSAALGFDFKRVTNAISNIDSATITLKD